MNMKETLSKLKKLVVGTPFRVSWFNQRLEKVMLTRVDAKNKGERRVMQLNQNTLISATDVVKANVEVWKRDEEDNPYHSDDEQVNAYNEGFEEEQAEEEEKYLNRNKIG